MNQLLSKRFNELTEQMEGVAATHTTTHTQMFGQSDNVNSERFLEWRVKVKKSNYYNKWGQMKHNSKFHLILLFHFFVF